MIKDPALLSHLLSSALCTRSIIENFNALKDERPEFIYVEKYGVHFSARLSKNIGANTARWKDGGWLLNLTLRGKPSSHY